MASHKVQSFAQFNVRLKPELMERIVEAMNKHNYTRPEMVHEMFEAYDREQRRIEAEQGKIEQQAAPVQDEHKDEHSAHDAQDAREQDTLRSAPSENGSIEAQA